MALPANASRDDNPRALRRLGDTLIHSGPRWNPECLYGNEKIHSSLRNIHIDFSSVCASLARKPGRFGVRRLLGGGLPESDLLRKAVHPHHTLTNATTGEPAGSEGRSGQSTLSPPETESITRAVQACEVPRGQFASYGHPSRRGGVHSICRRGAGYIPSLRLLVSLAPVTGILFSLFESLTQSISPKSHV